jgi:hypothetical protein
MKRSHEITGLDYRLLCQVVGVPYANLMRWMDRIRRDEPPVTKPGPQKVEPIDLEKLKEDMQGLSHGQSRTAGSGALQQQYRYQISRRDFLALLRQVRDEVKRTRRAMKRRVEWKAPALIWSVDDAELGRDGRGEKVMLNNIRDLSSKYTMEPLDGPAASGEEVAAHLESLFIQHGAPLVLKRDNGSNLNHHAVDRVLEKYFVIPLNSPPHYPPYNGGIEQGQGEMKRGLVGVAKKTSEDRHAHAAWRAHDLNHKERRSLHGAIACTVFSAGKARLKEYSNRKRKEIFEQISSLAKAVIEELRSERKWKSEKHLAAAAWRRSVETWLQQNGMIQVTHPKKVSPHSDAFSVS